MAQLIQSNQLSPIPGNAGDTSPIVRQGPTLGQSISDVANKTGALLDTAGTVYAQNRSQGLVEETIEEVDTARAAVDKQFKQGTAFTDTVPEGVDLGQKEWAMLQTAIASGQLTQERARLIASSRLRTKIASQPLFANKLREAASGVLGFNITSEPARQYFTSLPTEASLRSGEKTLAQKHDEEVALFADRLGLPADFVSQTILTADFAEQQKKAIAAQHAMGNKSAQKYTSEMEAEDQKTAFATVLGHMRAFEQAEGKPVDNVALSRIIDETKQTYIAEFNAGWTDGGGILNTEDYNRALGNINARYDEYKEFVTEYGIDNMTATQIQRLENMRELVGAEFFPQTTFIVKQFGQQVASDLMALTALSPSQIEFRLQGRPELRRAWNMLNKDSEAFTKGINTAYNKLLRGEHLTEQDMNFVDYIASEGYKTGAPETKDAIVESLATQGFNWKNISIIADESPVNATAFGKKTFEKQYQNSLEPALKIFAEEIALSPRLGWTVAENGDIQITTPSPAERVFGLDAGPGGLIEGSAERQEDIVAHSRAQQAADKINQFAKGLRNGWSNEVGEGVDQYRARITKIIQDNKTDAEGNNVGAKESTFIGLMEAGKIDEARSQYEAFQTENPELYPLTFEQLMEESNKLRGQRQPSGVSGSFTGGATGSF